MMMADEYNRRVVELFKSGKATPAQWAGVVGAIACAFDHDINALAEINKAVGFTAAQKVCTLHKRAAALAAASEDQKLQMILSSVEATERKAERAGNRRWKATRRRLGLNGPRVGVAVARPI